MGDIGTSRRGQLRRLGAVVRDIIAMRAYRFESPARIRRLLKPDWHGDGQDLVPDLCKYRRRTLALHLVQYGCCLLDVGGVVEPDGEDVALPQIGQGVG